MCYKIVKEIIAISIIWVLLSFQLEGQEVQEIGVEELTRVLSNESDSTYVVNFWATWCSPCVKEIGYFEELHRNYRESGLKVYLVSLDFPNQVDRRVVPFLKDKDITAEVLLMTNLDYNSWIDRVDPSWSGSIPATLIYRKDRRIFLEKELTRSELTMHVNQMLN